MSTPQSWSTVLDHSTDAAFRTWGLEFATKMAATGTMVQTTDTGQINWVTVVRAGIAANAGYEIWKLNDSLFATAPVYFRIDYGTGAATTAPRIQVTVGTGTNGAGTLTGTALTTTRTCTTSVAPSSTVTAYNSYMTGAEGFFGFSWKGGVGGSTNAARGSFFFTRNLNSAGALSATGGYVFWGLGATTSFGAYQNLRFAATAAAYTAVAGSGPNISSIPCVIPGAVASSLVGANNQAYLHFLAIPDVQCAFGLATALTTEVAVGNTFTMAPVAGVSHTYINLGAINPCETLGNTAVYGQCMLWE